MPIEYEVDHARRLVRAVIRGALTDPEVFAYQREVWSRPDVAGYDELADMTQAGPIAVPSAERVRELARLSAGADPAAPAAKLAIVAPGDLAFGLGRMYAAFRGQVPQGTRRVGVFRSRADALAWLAGEGEPPGSTADDTIPPQG